MPIYNRILVPVNLDADELPSLDSALDFAVHFKASVHFFYVNDDAAGYRHPADGPEAVSLRVKEAVPGDLLEKVSPVYAVSKGNVGDEVKKYANENAIDLVITTHTHHMKFIASITDSTSDKIVNSVDLPVLVLPDSE